MRLDSFDVYVNGVVMNNGLCKCGKGVIAGQWVCSECHAKYQREWRKKHPLTAEQRLKMKAQSYLAMYVKRGKVKRMPCEVCQEAKAKAYHEDYRKPLEVRWLCDKHWLVGKIWLGVLKSDDLEYKEPEYCEGCGNCVPEHPGSKLCNDCLARKNA